jgi:hypothetical protein
MLKAIVVIAAMPSIPTLFKNMFIILLLIIYPASQKGELCNQGFNDNKLSYFILFIILSYWLVVQCKQHYQLCYKSFFMIISLHTMSTVDNNEKVDNLFLIRKTYHAKAHPFCLRINSV